MRSCKACRERLGDKADTEIAEYPNASHGFDNPLGAVPARAAANDQSVREGSIRETAPGVLTNAATGQAFSDEDECVRLGPTVGHDPEATAAATRDVTVFLRDLFKL